jgi:hypothetical protein
MRYPHPSRLRAFTLLELMFSLAIIFVLIGQLIPATLKVREASTWAQCASHLKQLGLVVHNYHDVYRRLPPSRLDPNGAVSCAVLLLSYLEQQAFYEHWDLARRYYVHPKELRKTDVPPYHCPSRGSIIDDDCHGDIPRDGWPGTISYGGSPSDYAVCAGDNAATLKTPQADGAFVIACYTYVRPYLQARWCSRTSFGSLSDGLSNTFLLGEKHIADDRYSHTHNGDGSIHLDSASTKGAIHAFTKALAQNLIDKGIRVNCIAPGLVWTPLNPSDNKSPNQVAHFGEKTPLKRLAQPEEIAPAYIFFAADADSRYITGEVLTLLGGETTAR